MKLFLNISLLLLVTGSLSGQCLQMQNCPTDTVEYCDLSVNDTMLWNETYWWSPVYLSNNLPEQAVDLCFSVSDTCAGADLDIQYLLFLDLDGDGSQETVVSSADLQGFNTINFNNAANPNYSGGTPKAFDQLAVPAGEQYGFALELSGAANNRTACVRWNTQNNPGTYVQPELPLGNHRIKWIVSNGLGNMDSCDYNLQIRDCKAPVPICVVGLTANIMPSGSLTLWTSDFTQSITDNNTPGTLLEVGIRLAGNGSGFPVDTAGNPIINIVLDCADLGIHAVEIWARDLDGNTAHCETYIDLGDQAEYCTTPVYIDASICARLWCTGAVMSDWDLNIGAGFSPFDLDADGCYSADTTIIGPHYTITPSKDENDPLNGVDLLDLIKITTHILGIAPLSSPYAIIAADANNSQSVTTFDIVEIRKLLMGINDVLPNNTSWRFVKADYPFPNPQNPFAAIFPETSQLIAVNDTIQGEVNFAAIKIGDVDCTAIPGFVPDIKDRSVSPLSIQDHFLQAGETVEVPVRFTDLEYWLGFQLGLQYDPEVLALESVLPGAFPNWDVHSIVETAPGLLNIHWYDVQAQLMGPETPVFTLRFRALNAVQLSSAIRLASNKIRAEGFTSQQEGRNLELQFSAASVSEVKIGSAQPNPTASGATIPLLLPEPATVQIELFNLQGRKIWSRQSKLEAGAQQLKLPAFALKDNGVYIWQVVAKNQIRTGRIVVQH